MKSQTDQEFSHGFGKMVKGVHPLLLKEDQLSDTQNMLPGYEWKQRKGMSALTASAVASGLRWKSLCQFRDLKGNTDVILAHTYDSSGGEDLYQGSALPPNSITWTKKYDLTASCSKCQFANVAKTLLVANTKDFLIWRGTEHFPVGVWKYTAANTAYTLFADELFDGDTTTNMPLDSFDAGSDYWYVLSQQPLDTVSIVSGSANANETALIGWYWNGAWTQMTSGNGCGTFSDGTDSDGGNLGGEFEGTSYDASYWAESDANGKLSQNDGIIFTPDTDSTNATLVGVNGTLSGNFDVVVKVTVGTNTPTVASGYNDFRLYCRHDSTSNTDAYVGRQWTTTTIRHYSDIRTAGVRDDEGWTDVGATSELTWYYRINRTGTVIKTYEGEPGNWTELATDASWNTDDCHVLLYWNCQDEDKWDGNSTVHWVRNGISAAQSGDITWDPPSDEIQTEIDGVPGYAYRFGYTNDLDSDTTFTGLTVHSPISTVRNIWDGTPEPPTGCYVYDGTSYTDYMAYVNNTQETQYLDLSAVTTTDKIYVGFVERVNKIMFWTAAGNANSNNVSVTAIKYHNLSGAATSVGTVTDTTETDSSTFSQKGYMSWADPGYANEKMTIIGGDTTPMYWYEITVDAALSNPTYVYYIRGVPIHRDPDASYGCFAYKRRAWQIAPLNKENQVRYSAQDQPNVWNGTDSGYIEFGERPLLAAAPFYNETMLFADSELWMLQGNAPTNFGRLRVSAKVGTVSAQSVVSIESGVVVSDTVKVCLAWFFTDGIWMFDGVRIWKVSAPDIDSFFDPDHEDYINPSKLSETYGEYDFETQTVRWCVYSGSGTATTPTKVLVMHFPSLTYGIFDYATDIDAMLSVINSKYYLVGGGYSDGRFYQLDSGITDLLNGTATAVDAYVITRDEFLGYSDGLRQRLMSVWTEAQTTGGQIELDEYPDGSKTPQNIAKQSMTVTGKIFGALQKVLKFYPGQKTTKFRLRNRSKNARMKLLGYSTTVDKGRAEE